jgi:hypothetical protein
MGDRVPSSLKVFLLTLAILDDMGAIIIIALFYTANLQVDYLYLALIPLAGMVMLNLKGAAPYCAVHFACDNHVGLCFEVRCSRNASRCCCGVLYPAQGQMGQVTATLA